MNGKRIAVLMAAAFTGAALMFTYNTVAEPIIAKAGGLGNFYKYKECTATRYGETISGIKGKLSNYDVNNYSDQQYHHGVSVTRSGWRLATAPLYDDESWPIYPAEIWDAKGFSGYNWDGKQTFGTTSTQHTVTFIFTNGKISAKCSIRS